MRICVIGTGYTGIVFATCLADKGHRIVYVDMDHEKVALINRGNIPIYDNGIAELFGKNFGRNFSASVDLLNEVISADISIIAGTSTSDAESKTDLSYITTISELIGRAIKCKDEYHIVIVKSPVVPGTTDTVILPIIAKISGKIPGIDFGVGYNPDFIREGKDLEDLLHPQKVLIGGMDQKTIAIMENVYSVFSNIQLIKTNNKTAETIKHVADFIYGIVKTFSDEAEYLYTLAAGINFFDVLNGLQLDKRLYPYFIESTKVESVSIPSNSSETGNGTGNMYEKIDLNTSFWKKLHVTK
jgi:UDPglucose 6-dehydrogenase